MEVSNSDQDVMKIPYEEKIKGDEELKKENYIEAIKYYAKVSMGIKILYQDKNLTDEALDKYMREIGIPAMLNMSLCYMKREEWLNVLDTTDKILSLDQNNIKALYRKCIANINLNNYIEAEDDINKLQNNLDDPELIKMLNKKLQSKIKIVKEKEINVYKKMFKKYRDDRQIEEINETKNRFWRLLYNIPLVFKKLSKYGMELFSKPFGIFNNYGRDLVNYTFCRKKKIN